MVTSEFYLKWCLVQKLVSVDNRSSLLKAAKLFKENLASATGSRTIHLIKYSNHVSPITTFILLRLKVLALRTKL